MGFGGVLGLYFVRHFFLDAGVLGEGNCPLRAGGCTQGHQLHRRSPTLGKAARVHNPRGRRRKGAARSSWRGLHIEPLTALGAGGQRRCPGVGGRARPGAARSAPPRCRAPSGRGLGVFGETVPSPAALPQEGTRLGKELTQCTH